MLCIFFVSCTTYFLASLLTYDYNGLKNWFVDVSYLWAGLYLMATGILASLYTYSFTILIFKYRKHLRRTNFDAKVNL